MLRANEFVANCVEGLSWMPSTILLNALGLSRLLQFSFPKVADKLFGKRSTQVSAEHNELQNKRE
jgi:hypothetical protein